MKIITQITLTLLIPIVLYAQPAGDKSNLPNGCAENPDAAMCEPSDGLKDIGVTVKLNVFLEGPFAANEMSTELNEQGKIPLAQPFNSPPWNWPGLEKVDVLPNDDIVDWVLVDLRDATDPSLATYASTCGRKAAFLLNDGRIVDLDGESALFLQTAYM